MRLREALNAGGSPREGNNRAGRLTAVDQAMQGPRLSFLAAQGCAAGPLRGEGSHTIAPRKQAWNSQASAWNFCLRDVFGAWSCGRRLPPPLLSSPLLSCTPPPFPPVSFLSVECHAVVAHCSAAHWGRATRSIVPLCAVAAHAHGESLTGPPELGWREHCSATACDRNPRSVSSLGEVASSQGWRDSRRSLRRSLLHRLSARKRTMLLNAGWSGRAHQVDMCALPVGLRKVRLP